MTFKGHFQSKMCYDSVTVGFGLVTGSKVFIRASEMQAVTDVATLLA